ncbi:MAG: nucleotidyltransferase domain-containing protein [Caldilineaceae bacterium]|nr:nucleotidyltransferase domain-containing protein [Caldilineaceae bacterium]
MSTEPMKTNNLDSLFATFPRVIAAWHFGSTSVGRARPDSDIDIGVLFDAPPTLDEWLDLHAALQDALNAGNLDLVVLNGKTPVLRYAAICGHRLYCRSLEEMATFSSLTARQYEDSMALLARGFAARKAALARAKA